MVLFKRRPAIRLSIYTGFMLISLLSNGLSSSDDLRQLKERMADLQSRIAQEELLGKDLSLKEKQLTKKIYILKKDAKKNTNLILNIRIENLLKELRENLMTHQENENRRTLLEDQITKTKEELDGQMGIEINRLILFAQETFKKGDEKQSDRSYQDALHLMEERKQFQTETLADPPTLPSLGEFILDGKESLEKLKEASDFGNHDLEILSKEIRYLEGVKRKTVEEIALRKNLIKYQGLLERGDAISPMQNESIEKELIQFEKKRKMIENKLIKVQEAKEALFRNVRKIERMIEQKQP